MHCVWLSFGRAVLRCKLGKRLILKTTTGQGDLKEDADDVVILVIIVVILVIIISFLVLGILDFQRERGRDEGQSYF